MLNKNNSTFTIAFASIVALALLISFAPMLSTSMQNAQATTLSNTNTSAAEMKAVQDLTTKNLTTDEQQKNNPFFRIVWGDIQTITPGQSIALFADCNTGEFANSGLKILGKDVQVLEDYPIALPDNSMSWLTVVYNGNSESLPVSNGVVCVSDNGQTSSSSSGVDSTTKNIIHNTINQFIQQGNTNILQLIQIQQILIQQAIQIINVTGNNNTVTAIINQTANQIANMNVTNPDIINNIGNDTAQNNGVNPNQPETPVDNSTSTTTNNELPPGTSLNTNPDNSVNSTGGSEILTTTTEETPPDTTTINQEEEQQQQQPATTNEESEEPTNTNTEPEENTQDNTNDNSNDNTNEGDSNDDQSESDSNNSDNPDNSNNDGNTETLDNDRPESSTTTT